MAGPMLRKHPAVASLFPRQHIVRRSRKLCRDCSPVFAAVGSPAPTSSRRSARSREPTTRTKPGSSSAASRLCAHLWQAYRRLVGPKGGAGELQHVEAHGTRKIGPDNTALFEGLVQGFLDANVERRRKRV